MEEKTEEKTTAEVGITECTKVIDMLGSFAAQAQNIDWTLLSAELSNLDEVEKKELLTLAAKKILAGLLVILS